LFSDLVVLIILGGGKLQERERKQPGWDYLMVNKETITQWKLNWTIHTLSSLMNSSQDTGHASTATLLLCFT
jgi:hypothetical protein